MRIAVLGLGGVGCAAARFLAADGHTVVGFEQYTLDHDRGSSYGGSRIIRRVYDDPYYVELMERAYPLWEALERDAGESLLVRCGGLFFAPAQHPRFLAAARALGALGVPHELWDAAQVALRFPQFRLRAGEQALFEPETGFLRASRCVLAQARLARALGADLREGVRVEAVDPAPGGIRVRAAGAVHCFDAVVMAPGPWAASLPGPAPVMPVRVSRQQYAHFVPAAQRESFAPGTFPVWIDLDREVYGFPEHDDHPGAKVADHARGPSHDPDSADREPREEPDAYLRDYLATRIPLLAGGEITHRKVCLYTLTPDEDFLLDHLPQEPRVWLCGGLSGHGFKFTVFLGWLLSRLVAGKDHGCNLRRFALGRFL
jgi:sarcosine oxidase